jgi:hypothetical protein
MAGARGKAKNHAFHISPLMSVLEVYGTPIRMYLTASIMLRQGLVSSATRSWTKSRGTC